MEHNIFLLILVGCSVSVAGPSSSRARFCGFGGDRDLLIGLQQRWPTLEYCRAYDEGQIENMKALARDARALGIPFSVQSCAPVFPPGYLQANQCWAIDFLNRRPADLGIGHPVADYCHPASLAALKHNLDVALRDVGAVSFTMVDYVWPWVGGRWGYSEADILAYRAALAGEDSGLTVVDSGTTRTLSFWDYFEELSGLRLEPSEVGCAAWRDYEPARPNDVGVDATPEQRRNLFLFYGLYHYCWLRFAQEGGEYARQLGGELQASLNPENFGNGTDLLMWGRLQATGEPWLEQWGSAWIAIATYHNLWYFTRPFRENGKRLGLIGETGAAGGHPDSGFGPARPHYWDEQSNYAITYAVGVAGQFDDREEDYIWAPLQEMQDPGGPYADIWRGYERAMDGFCQVAADGARRPDCDVLSISTRSVLYHADNSDGSTAQPYSLSAPLIDLHYDYHQGYFPLTDDTLAQHRVILFAPWEYPAGFLTRLHRWLEGRPDRVLITHSFVPTRPCKGLIQSPVPEVDEAQAAAELGLFSLRQTPLAEGTVSTIAARWETLIDFQPDTKVSLPHPLVACAGKALVKLGEEALVTEVRVPGGGRIVYLNFCAPERYAGPDDPHSALLRACLKAALVEAGETPQAEGSPHWACARYELPGAHVFYLMDARAAGQDRFTEETASMAPAEKLSLLLEPDTQYTVFDMLRDQRALGRTDARGRLPIHLSGRNMRLLRVTPTSAP